MEANKRNKTSLGLGIALGLVFGAALGAVFFQGQILMGLILGLLYGVTLSLLADQLQEKVLYPLILCAALAVPGGLLGFLIGLLHGRVEVSTGHAAGVTLFGLPYQGGYALMCAVIASSIGLAVGTVIAIRKKAQEAEINSIDKKG